MPVVSSKFRPPFYLREGHLQTVLAAILPRRIDVTHERERLELSDGDFLDLDWLRRGRGRLAVLSHGLEASSHARYIRGLAMTLDAAGWDVLAWNFRGCSGEPNRLLRAYHSGETGDLDSVIRHALRSHRVIALVGFSLGGNITLKYVGERVCDPAIVAAVGVSTPVDLASSARALDERWDNRIYLRRFITPLVAMIEAKARMFPGQLDVRGVRAIRTFREFDDRFTARMHGFRDAADYWTQASARQFLPRITVPTLLINARNDPFLTPECFPCPEAEASAHFFLEAPDSGGHAGFLDLRNGLQPWSERRIAEFIGNAASAIPSGVEQRS